MKSSKNIFFDNFERYFFIVIGIFFIGYSIYLLIHFAKMTETSVIFGLGFLSFIYSNVSRFKKFKGLGFEAELWEDKQKEAEVLTERLRNLVKIYSHEIMKNNIISGRWDVGTKWSERWSLFDEIIKQHEALEQKIDFSETKHLMDSYFLFDIQYLTVSELDQAIQAAMGRARSLIQEKYGNPVLDANAFGAEMQALNEFYVPINDYLTLCKTGDLAGEMLRKWRNAAEKLSLIYGISLEIDNSKIELLEKASMVSKKRPIPITAGLIKLADRV